MRCSTWESPTARRKNMPRQVEEVKQAVRVKPDWGEAYNALGDSYLTLIVTAEAADA